MIKSLRCSEAWNWKSRFLLCKLSDVFPRHSAGTPSAGLQCSSRLPESVGHPERLRGEKSLKSKILGWFTKLGWQCDKFRGFFLDLISWLAGSEPFQRLTAWLAAAIARSSTRTRTILHRTVRGTCRWDGWWELFFRAIRHPGDHSRRQGPICRKATKCTKSPYYYRRIANTYVMYDEAFLLVD